MARRTKEDAEKTYQSLLDAATKVFRERGVSKTTLNEIATSAGVTRGAVYWHFDNKDAVIKALWEKSAGVEFKNLKSALEPFPREKPLEIFIDLIKDLITRALTDENLNQTLHILTSSMEFTTFESELQRFFREQREDLYMTFLKFIEQLQSVGAVSHTHSADFITNGLWIFLTGIVRTHVEMDNIDITEKTDSYIEIWLKTFQSTNQTVELQRELAEA